MYGNKDEEPRAIRLLVLEAEEPHPEIQDRRGRYHDMFHELFSNAGARENPPIKVKSDARYIVEEENPLPTMEEMREKYDGVVISGSNYDAHGNNEWILKLVSWLQGKKSSGSVHRANKNFYMKANRNLLSERPRTSHALSLCFHN